MQARPLSPCLDHSPPVVIMPAFSLAACRFLMVLCFLAQPLAAQWPQFRGPAANGAAEGELPLQWSDTSGIAWKSELPGPGASSPIVVGGKVLVSCFSGYGADPQQPGEMANLKRHAICVNLEDGKRLWSREVPAALPETKFAGRYITLHGFASSTPVSDGERVYFFFGKSGVFAYTLEGEKIWQTLVGDQPHAWGSGASPILHGDLLIVNASLESDALVALNKNTGERVWQLKDMPRAWNTPALLRPPGSDREELVVNVRGRVRGIDPQSGQELWSCRAINAAELCPSIVGHDGVAYVLGSPRGEGLAVRIGGRGDVTDSHLLWRINKGSNVGSPVYHDGHLYWAHNQRGIVYCVEAATGKIVYEKRLQPNPGRIYASPILAAGCLYYVSRTQGTFVVAAKPEFELLAHNRLGENEEVFNGSPAVAAARLLLRSDRALYCIETNDLAE